MVSGEHAASSQQTVLELLVHLRLSCTQMIGVHRHMGTFLTPHISCKTSVVTSACTYFFHSVLRRLVLARELTAVVGQEHCPGYSVF